MSSNVFEGTGTQFSETRSWRAWKKYSDGFLAKNNVRPVLDERRKYYKGDHYDKAMDESIPKPVMNICFEYVEKVRAKLNETPYAVEFTTLDERKRDMNDIDKFYEYQQAKMNDRDTNAKVIKRALIDGVGCCFTMYDADTYGIKGRYRGYLKRKVVNFENVFFANPYCEDPQDQEYLGFVQKISVEEARNLCEVESRKKFIVPDMFDVTREYDPDDIAFDTCTLVTRYYRDKDGEVVFELSTQYCDLFRKPHHIRPGIDDADNTIEDGDRDEDYADMSEERITVQTKPEGETESGYEEKLKVFWRYPFSWYRPYPINGIVLGDSVISQLIPIQKQVNFTNMMAMMDFQNHGFAKWVVQEGALADGETINNDPGQILHVKVNPGTAIGSVVQRIDPSNVSAEQLNQGNALITLARQVYGFDNLTAENSSSDSSGYALQQIQKQMNLVLEDAQNLLWDYVRSNAETDILFFRDYIDEAYFFARNGSGEVSKQDAYKDMTQNIYDAYGATPEGADENGQLPATPTIVPMKVESRSFMKDFDVCVEVTQGVATSQISESQHYSQVFQWISTGNMDASLAKAWVNCDPAFSRKTRENLMSALDAYENGQLQTKQAEIDQLKQYIKQLQSQFQDVQYKVNYQSQQLDAYKKASQENAQQNEAVTKAMSKELKKYQDAESEGEVKSNNARGVEGSSFDSYTDENPYL